LIALLAIFANNILPIFLTAGGGYLSARILKLNPRPFSQIIFYVLSPCLIFNLLTSSSLPNQEIMRMVGFTIMVILTLGAITWILGAVLRLERRLLVAVLITTMFCNAGNYGLSLNLFAFGETALAYASLYFVTMTILTFTIGVFAASLGSSGIKQSLAGLFRVPMVYALIIAVLINRFTLNLPLPLERTIIILGNAALPMMMLLLGIQLGNANWDGKILALGFTNIMRLMAAPLVAIFFSMVFKLSGVALQAGITEASMPTAVVVTVLATEYDVYPSFMTTAVFTSTLLSPLTVTPILAYLGA